MRRMLDSKKGSGVKSALDVFQATISAMANICLAVKYRRNEQQHDSSPPQVAAGPHGPHDGPSAHSAGSCPDQHGRAGLAAAHEKMAVCLSYAVESTG